MLRLRICLAFILALLLLGSGSWLPSGNAAPDSPVPVGLRPLEWLRIQEQVAQLIAADGKEYDSFGWSVAVSGEMAIVGAYQAHRPTSMGAAYVFYRNHGGVDAWGQVGKLIAADGAEGDYFGWSVSASGDMAVVGAIFADNGGSADQGAAYVFYRDQGGADAWGQVAKLTAADGATGDSFGESVAASGDTVVVGARTADPGDTYDQGAAYVFYRNQGGPDTWGQVAKLTAADGGDDDYFGKSVSLSGDTAVVGTPDALVDSKEDQGAAYVFYRDQGGPDTWGQVAKLTAADGNRWDYFGYSVAVSGETVVVGAHDADVGTDDLGAAYVFYRDQGGAGAWGQVAKLAAGDGVQGDQFGLSVAASGDTIVVGAPNADAVWPYQGVAYVFYRNLGGADAWGQGVKLTASDGAAGDGVGLSVAVSGDTAVVGAPGYWDVGGDNQGAAYVFALPAAPLAADDAYCTPKDTLLAVPAALGVLANDNDADGSLLRAVLDSDPAHGSLEINFDGSFVYMPTIGFTEVDTFTYHAYDGMMNSNIATVRITIPCHCIYLPLVLRNH